MTTSSSIYFQHDSFVWVLFLFCATLHKITASQREFVDEEEGEKRTIIFLNLALKMNSLVTNVNISKSLLCPSFYDYSLTPKGEILFQHFQYFHNDEMFRAKEAYPIFFSMLNQLRRHGALVDGPIITNSTRY